MVFVGIGLRNTGKYKMTFNWNTIFIVQFLSIARGYVCNTQNNKNKFWFVNHYFKILYTSTYGGN